MDWQGSPGRSGTVTASPPTAPPWEDGWTPTASPWSPAATAPAGSPGGGGPPGRAGAGLDERGTPPAAPRLQPQQPHATLPGLPPRQDLAGPSAVGGDAGPAGLPRRRHPGIPTATPLLGTDRGQPRPPTGTGTPAHPHHLQPPTSSHLPPAPQRDGGAPGPAERVGAGRGGDGTGTPHGARLIE